MAAEKLILLIIYTSLNTLSYSPFLYLSVQDDFGLWNIEGSPCPIKIAYAFLTLLVNKKIYAKTAICRRNIFAIKNDLNFWHFNVIVWLFQNLKNKWTSQF